MLIPLDEEAAKESLVFTTEIKVTKAKKEGNNQDNIKKSAIENSDEEDMEEVTKKFIPKINNRQFCRLFRRFNGNQRL